jgi:beta-galactosidase
VEFDEHSEYWLRISLHEKTDRLWCEKGYEVAKSQLLLKNKTVPSSNHSLSQVNVAHIETDDEVMINSASFSATVSKSTGELTSWKINGAEQLKSPLRSNFWRPLTDNDSRFRKFAEKKKVWRDLRTNLKTSSVNIGTADEHAVEVWVKQAFEEQVRLDTIYTFFGDGSIAVKLDLDADESLPDLPKFGMTMGIPADYANTTYYGNGPWESYSDRKRSAEVGEFELKTDDLFYNYAKPQENGNRTDTRWVKLSADGSQPGILVTGLPQFNFSVWPFSADNIEMAKHPFDLKPQGFYTLNIDLAQTGLGGMKAVPLPHQRVPSGKLRFEFLMGPMK